MLRLVLPRKALGNDIVNIVPFRMQQGGEVCRHILVELESQVVTSVCSGLLFEDLSLEQIADLCAFLETSKNNPEPATPAAGK